jgi:nicotinate-nucleotide adenylyltransferase
MRAGVLGGTFDPPHLGHLVLAASAREALHLDRVLFVPAGMPWRKAERVITDAALRVRLTQAAVEALTWAEVDQIEVEREGPSYASETMRLLAARAARDSEWWFILGADALADLPNWHEPESLLEVARLAMGHRGGMALPEALPDRFPGIEMRLDHVPMPALSISSSELRARIRDGRPTDVWLPAAVREVIDEAGLYRN